MKKLEMNPKKSFAILFVFFIMFLLMVEGVFPQVKKEVPIVYSGIIKSISIDYTSMVVNNEIILILPSTRVFDEIGKPLKTEELKSKMYVMIEGTPGPKGFSARKIAVSKPPEV